MGAGVVTDPKTVKTFPGRDKPIFDQTGLGEKARPVGVRLPTPRGEVVTDKNHSPFGLAKKDAPAETKREACVREDPHDEHRLLFPIKVENDIVAGGTETWKLCIQYGFSTLEAMQIRTAFSELARNILKYAKEGEVIFRRIGREGIRLTFVDHGPGIADLDQAMRYGFSSSGSLGLGLPGSKKLADRFEILSTPGKGTQVTFEKFTRIKAPRRTDAILRQRLIQDRPSYRNAGGKALP